MDHSKLRERSLRQLLEDNFKVARQCRKMAENISDPSLKYYFQNLASRRSQFAMEIAEEISYYGGKEPYMSSASYERNRLEPRIDDQFLAIKMAFKAVKESLHYYQNALCQICDGSCREILLRHKAYIENCVFELKSLKTLMKYVPFSSREGSKEKVK